MRPKFTGSKHTASANGSSASKESSDDGKPTRYPFYAVCISNADGPMLVRPGVVYRIIKPLENDPEHMLRVIDDEGEDYLYPARWFVPIDLPPRAQRALIAASKRELART